MPELPAHASPVIGPLEEHEGGRMANVDGEGGEESMRRDMAGLRLDGSRVHNDGSRISHDPSSLQLETLHQGQSPPRELLSPALTPPATPGTGTPPPERDARSVVVDRDALPAPKLMERLPVVNCVVRARIPTTTGQEMFLHLYENDADSKEHLAIVFGPHIRSRSLDAPREGETEMDRMIRGAYTGRLFPGRMSSGFDRDAMGAGEGQASPLLKSLHKTTGVPAPEAKHVQHQLPLVRIHSECYTGETVWSARCDCGEQLDEAARLMSLPSARATGGVIIYLRQEGRGIGLGEKLKAYNLQDLGSDTVEANLLLRHPADARSYGLATAMLVDLGLGTDLSDANAQEDAPPSDPSTTPPPQAFKGGIRLLTNNPDKIRALEGPNREVTVKERVAMVPLAWSSGGTQGFKSKEVASYLQTKIEKMGHMLQMG